MGEKREKSRFLVDGQIQMSCQLKAFSVCKCQSFWIHVSLILERFNANILKVDF